MFDTIKVDLKTVLQKNLAESEFEWLVDAIEQTKKEGTSRKLYLNYSLCGNKISRKALDDLSEINSELSAYLKIQQANTVEIARIYFLTHLLGNNSAFVDPVKNLIQVADKSELEGFLKFLVLLPSPENYQFAAVEALRTNISTVFDAISKHNPYPAEYFTDQQWNQMFLKAAFMQQDLGAMVSIDERANADLARIISDYAHERWAASRTIDPLFWRPVSNYLEGVLVDDVKRLFSSENIREQRSAALVCFNSKLPIAAKLMKNYPELKSEIDSGKLTWETLND